MSPLTPEERRWLKQARTKRGLGAYVDPAKEAPGERAKWKRCTDCGALIESKSEKPRCRRCKSTAALAARLAADRKQKRRQRKAAQAAKHTPSPLPRREEESRA